MNIGIIVAMGKELNLVTPHLHNASTRTVDTFTFHTGQIGNNTVTVMQCGIGKVNAALGALTMIKCFGVKAIINSGVAGGADSNVNVMDVVVASRVAYHDVYCGPESVTGQVQGLPLYYPCSQPLLQHITPDAYTHVGLICSGDQFIDTEAQIATIKRNFPDALAVDMESAAIAHTCHLMHTDFLSLRVISDSPGAGKNNTQQYTDFWQTAPEHTFAVLYHLLQSIQ